jgi:transforming growth factor-beta-induced protein
MKDMIKLAIVAVLSIGSLQATITEKYEKTASNVHRGNYGLRQQTIAERLEANPEFSTLVQVLKKYGLFNSLKDKQASLTLLAPTNEAFKKIENALQTLSKKEILDILKSHVLALQYSSKAAIPEQIETLAAKISKKGIVFKDKKSIKTANGYIHALDEVILPQ